MFGELLNKAFKGLVGLVMKTGLAEAAAETTVKIGAGVAATGAAAYGVKKGIDYYEKKKKDELITNITTGVITGAATGTAFVMTHDFIKSDSKK